MAGKSREDTTHFNFKQEAHYYQHYTYPTQSTARIGWPCHGGISPVTIRQSQPTCHSAARDPSGRSLLMNNTRVAWRPEGRNPRATFRWCCTNCKVTRHLDQCWLREPSKTVVVNARRVYLDHIILGGGKDEHTVWGSRSRPPWFGTCACLPVGKAGGCALSRIPTGREGGSQGGVIVGDLSMNEACTWDLDGACACDAKMQGEGEEHRV